MGAVTRDPRFCDLVWIDPDAETVVGLVWYGYPAEAPNPARRPLGEVSVSLPWARTPPRTTPYGERPLPLPEAPAGR